MNNTAYEQAGVDVESGDSFSSFAGEICRSTWNNSPFVKITDLSSGLFRGPRGFEFQGLPRGTITAATTDGVGTKSIITSASGDFYQAGYDVVAMCAGDITRYGGIPLVFLNCFDTRKLGKPNETIHSKQREILQGLSMISERQKFVVLQGETAELRDCVTSEIPLGEGVAYNWAGMMIGAYDPEKMIKGENIEVGDVIIGLQEYGFRSNGISLVRTILRQKYGDEWWQNQHAMPAITNAAKPSSLYDHALCELNRWYGNLPETKGIKKVKAIAHISGGGIPSKLGEDILFPRGLSATLDSLVEPPGVMKVFASWWAEGRTPYTSHREIYDSWHGGPGVLMIVRKEDVDPCINFFESRHITAERCGEIVSGQKPSLEIHSRFYGNEVFEVTPKDKE